MRDLCCRNLNAQKRRMEQAAADEPQNQEIDMEAALEAQLPTVPEVPQLELEW